MKKAFNRHKLKRTWLIKLLLPIYHFCIDMVCDFRRKPLIKPLKNRLKQFNLEKEDFNLSIISTNCFAGRIMQDFGMAYNSPTVGLYFMYPDYIKFLQNLRYYLTEAKLEFVENSKYALCNERRSLCEHWYPIARLGNNVEIHFLHYHTEEEAAEKWYRRAKRVNFDNLLIIGMQQNLCQEQDIIDFDKLPFKNKIMFSNNPLNLRSNEYMPEFKNSDYVGDPYKKGHLFYRHLLNHFS